jgi:hypothetical protein
LQGAAQSGTEMQPRRNQFLALLPLLRLRPLRPSGQRARSDLAFGVICSAAFLPPLPAALRWLMVGIVMLGIAIGLVTR